MNNLVFDIRTSEKALESLTNITQVPLSKWEEARRNISKYECPEDFVEDTVLTNGYLPKNHRSFVFTFSHITTSANECSSYKKHGLLDLRQSYLCPDSELRVFLDQHNILINVDEKVLSYNGKKHDITYSRGFATNLSEDYRRQVAFRFFKDSGVCGYLSMDPRSTYPGDVHLRPEILKNIDGLLGLSLSEEWKASRIPYEVTAIATGEKIEIFASEKSDKEIVVDFLTNAYNNAFGAISEKRLQLKSQIQVVPADIINIQPLT